MKKIFTRILIMSTFVCSAIIAQAQNSTTLNHAEAVGSGNSTSVGTPTTQAILDHQFTYDITTATGGSVGNAGIVYVGGVFWVSQWQSDTVWVLSNTGALISYFNVGLGAGGGIRAMTTDGTNVYAAQNGPEILVLDTALQGVASTIPLATSFAARSVSYDPTLDGGAGGFWVSNFATDIAQVSMTGAVLSSIPAATHTLTGMYGTAVDNISSLTNKYLWIFNQPGNPGAEIWQLDAATGTLVGVSLDVNALLGYAGLAGGICVAEGILPQPSLCGLVQQTPNSIEGFELTLASGINDVNNGDNVDVFPIPATDHISFIINDKNSSDLQVEIYDIRGNKVESFKSTEKRITVSTSEYASGTYTVKISGGNSVTSRKFIVKN